MTLEQEAYYQSLMVAKGRSASICVPGMDPSGGGSMSGRTTTAGVRRQPSSSMLRENGQSARYKDDYISSGGGGANMMQVQNCSSGTPTRPRKAGGGAHRSQSARVIGANRPKVKRRERDVREYQQHLDLASSEGALRDCQESYNPFLKKVPSSGRLITSASLEMSSGSLYGTPPPQSHQSTPPVVPPPNSSQQQSQLVASSSSSAPHHQQLLQQLTAEPPRDSPKIIRRHSGGGSGSVAGVSGDRRGSDKSTPEKDKSGGAPSGNFIPVIATPESSPISSRRSNKPQGLPKSPQVSRSGSTRRTNSVKSPRRSTTAGFLDVPDRDNNHPAITPPPPEDGEDEESYRLRSFSVTPKGIVNRGDSFRRRRSRSNSLIPTPTTPEPHRNGPFTSEDGLLLPGNIAPSELSSNRSPVPSPKSSPRPSCAGIPVVMDHDHEVVRHRVAMIGARGVGKTALVSQFMTSECINAYDHDRQNDVEGEETVSVMLNGEESELTFFKMNNPKTELNRSDPPDAFVLVYSVVDRSSFQKVEQELRRLQEWDLLRSKAVVLVANKIDLARSRAVSTNDGRCLAVSFRVKFVEVSVGINHNVDELLVGLLHQIRLKSAQTGSQESWCKHRGILRASVKARQMLTWLLGKEDAKFKNCENLHIL